VGAADQMHVALEVVELQALQDHLAGAAGARRDADDRDRARIEESRDRLRAARGVRAAHAASLSGCQNSRCSPLASGCQYGFTFMPTFRSSAAQLTTPAIRLTPTSSVTLAIAYGSLPWKAGGPRCAMVKLYTVPLPDTSRHSMSRPRPVKMLTGHG